MRSSQPVDQGVTWFLPQMDNMRFLRAQYVQHAFKPHAHDYFVLGIIEAGLQSFTYRRERLVTPPGKLIIINPGEVHTGEAAIADGFAYRALYPTPDLVTKIACDVAQQNVSLPVFSGGLVHDNQLCWWLQHIHRLSETPSTLLELEYELTRFLGTLLHRYANHHGPQKQGITAHPAVFLVRDYLEAHYAEDITLADLSKVAHISAYHLARLFRQHIGMPPHRYLENVRIRHAERLLDAGMPIAEVACATGFSSQSHLNRTFKRFLGTTPGAFVKQRKIVEDIAPVSAYHAQ